MHRDAATERLDRSGFDWDVALQNVIALSIGVLFISSATIAFFM